MEDSGFTGICCCTIHSHFDRIFSHALHYKEMFIGIDFTLPLVHEGHISTVLSKLMDDAHQ
jgi:hypothetical protein